MGSVRKVIGPYCGRCLRGSCYGVGFVTTSAIMIGMLWILWCYLGLVSIPSSLGQRRAVVHYPATTSKPNLTSPSTSRGKELYYNLTSSERVTQNSITGSRSQASGGRYDDLPGTLKDSDTNSRTPLDKGDFDARDKTRTRPHNGTSSSSALPKTDSQSPGTSTIPKDRYNPDGPRRTGDDTESTNIRMVSSLAPENRPSISSNKDSARTDEKSIPPKTDRNIDDRKIEDTLPPKRIIDDEERRPVRPVERDVLDDRRTRDEDDRDRIPVRDRDRRPLDTDGRRRDSYDDDDDSSRRRYDKRDDEYDDKVASSRRIDDVGGGRRRLPDNRRQDYDTPSERDYRYRERDPDRSRDDRYIPPPGDRPRDPETDDRYKGRYNNDDAPRRRRPIYDDYPEKRDERYRDSDVRSRPKDPVPDDRYKGDDDQYRSRPRDDDRSESKSDRRRYDDDDDRRRVSDERPYYDDRDRYEPRSEVDSPTRKVDSTRDAGRRPDVLPRDSVDGTVVRDRDDSVRTRPYDRTIEKDDRYTGRDREVYPSRFKDDDDRPIGRDPPRSQSRARPDDVRAGDTGVRRPIASDDRDKDLRSGDSYERPRRRDRYDDDDRYSGDTSKGESRDREKSVYISEDRLLSGGSSPSKIDSRIDPRSHTSSDDDYVRGPREEPKSSRGDTDDRYSSRRTDPRDDHYDDRYSKRPRYDDDDDHRDKGDHGRDRIDPYDKTIDDRSYSGRDSTYEDRRSPTRTRATDERRPLDDPRDEYRNSDRRRYDSDPKPRRSDDDDDYKRRDYDRDSRSRDPVIREKRDPVEPCDRRDGPREDCGEVSRHPAEIDDDERRKSLSPKDVIDAAIKLSELPPNKPKEVFYPVYDPRVSNLTSPEVIKPSERRGTTITNRRKRRNETPASFLHK